MILLWGMWSKEKNMNEGVIQTRMAAVPNHSRKCKLFQPDNISLILDENIMKTKGQ